jgi:hypothetical protein
MQYTKKYIARCAGGNALTKIKNAWVALFAQVFMDRVMRRVGLGIRNCTNPCWVSKLIIMVIKKIKYPVFIRTLDY